MNVKKRFSENHFLSRLKPNKEFFTKFTKKKLIIITAIVLIAALSLFFIFGGKKKGDDEAQAYTETAAQKMDISETIEQSGVVEPYERYEITSLVKGEIISSPFEEGDFVNEGDTLYQIDDEDAQLNIEKMQNSIEKSQISLNETNKDIANLNIYAPASGKLTDFNLKIGDTVGNGTVAKIINTDSLTVNIPFAVNDYDKISVGNSVTITSALYMTSLSGRVTHKYDATAGTGNDGSVLKNVEIEIANPGALAEGTTFAATVQTSYGSVSSAGSGTIDGGTETKVNADVSGTVSYLAVKEGDYVKSGQLIARLISDNLSNTKKNNELNLKDSQLSLKSSQKSLDDYNITAPISGTVITKNSKAGDKIDNSNSSTVMMVVADMSKMKFTISVDELDISDIQLGQTAVVDADALPDETFEATVTSISNEGTSSGDGVTTYSVELTIYEPGNLKSGMNVNANILINEAKDVIGIPEDALMNTKGNQATVLVKTENGKSDKKKADKESGGNQPDNSEMPKDGGKGGSADGNAPTADGKGSGNAPTADEMPKGGGNAPTTDSKSGGDNAPAMRGIPDGCEMRTVEVGISDGTNIEIVSGLSEGETVVYIPSTASSDDSFMGMMMGGRPGGGGGPQGGGPGGGGGAPGGMR